MKEKVRTPNHLPTKHAQLNFFTVYNTTKPIPIQQGMQSAIQRHAMQMQSLESIRAMNKAKQGQKGMSKLPM
jgi:hypothetical protein